MALKLLSEAILIQRQIKDNLKNETLISNLISVLLRPFLFDCIVIRHHSL